MIRCALALGFTVEELSRILRARDRGEAPCRDVRALAGEKLVAFEARRRELELLCKHLRTTLKQWDSRLANQRNGQAGLLQELARRVPGLGEMGSPLVAPALQRKRKRTP
jgi:DNA-binding transcriptional MerR regulator